MEPCAGPRLRVLPSSDRGLGPGVVTVQPSSETGMQRYHQSQGG